MQIKLFYVNLNDWMHEDDMLTVVFISGVTDQLLPYSGVVVTNQRPQLS